jgi:hypothetical protein
VLVLAPRNKLIPASVVCCSGLGGCLAYNPSSACRRPRWRMWTLVPAGHVKAGTAAFARKLAMSGIFAWYQWIVIEVKKSFSFNDQPTRTRHSDKYSSDLCLDGPQILFARFRIVVNSMIIPTR